MSTLSPYLPDSRAAVTLLISLVVLQLGVYALPVVKYCHRHPVKAAIHGLTLTGAAALAMGSAGNIVEATHAALLLAGRNLQARASAARTISLVLLGCGGTYFGYHQGFRTLHLLYAAWSESYRNPTDGRMLWVIGAVG